MQKKRMHNTIPQERDFFPVENKKQVNYILGTSLQAIMGIKEL